MTTSLRIRAAAVRDLRSIRDYTIREHGYAAAEAYLATLDAAMQRLREWPELGQARPELGECLRCLPCREHHVFYVHSGRHISIVRVLHKSMDSRRRLR